MSQFLSLPKAKLQEPRFLIAISVVTTLIVAFFTATIFLFASPSAEPGLADESDSNSADAPSASFDDNSDELSSDLALADPDAPDKTPLQYEGEDPNASDKLSAYVSFYGPESDSYLINVAIDQYLSSGSCSLRLGGYQGSVAIEPSASTAFCSFLIPSSQLSPGPQPLAVTISSGERETSIEEEINVKL